MSTDYYGYVAAFLTTIAFLPQVLRTYRRKSADDVSSDQKNTHVEALIREKDKSIERLEKQLSEANLQNNRFMESIVGLQKQMSNLNQRLLLNEPSESMKPNIMEVQVERSSESEDGVLVNEVPPETSSLILRNIPLANCPVSSTCGLESTLLF